MSETRVVHEQYPEAVVRRGRIRKITAETGALVLAFSSVLDEERVVEAMKSGADGILSKTVDGSAMMAALEAVASGDGVRTVRGGGSHAEPVWPGGREGLSAGEAAVTCLIVAGMSNQGIADALFMSTTAVKARLRSAYRTMGVTNRVEAIEWGIDHGFQLHAPVARLGEGGQQ